MRREEKSFWKYFNFVEIFTLLVIGAIMLFALYSIMQIL